MNQRTLHPVAAGALILAGIAVASQFALPSCGKAASDVGTSGMQPGPDASSAPGAHWDASHRAPGADARSAEGEDRLADRAIFGIDPVGRIRFERLYPADQVAPRGDFMTARHAVGG